MVEIGGRPILWHIMKIYSHYGFNDFIIGLGYKGYMIKEYFYHYFIYNSDLTINLSNNQLDFHDSKCEPWTITLIDTGLTTQTGGRIKRIQNYIGKETFMVTYGDGVGNLNIRDLINFHYKHGKYATITAVQPSGRFGALNLDDKDNVLSFEEKPRGDKAWINGGFFVLEPEIFEYIKGDDTLWEKEPLENLARDGQLVAYRHSGFWKPMDTLRDKRELEALWDSGSAPWKVWKE